MIKRFQLTLALAVGTVVISQLCHGATLNRDDDDDNDGNDHNKQDGDDSGIGTGAIIGIVLGILILVAVGVGLFLSWRFKRLCFRETTKGKISENANGFQSTQSAITPPRVVITDESGENKPDDGSTEIVTDPRPPSCIVHPTAPSDDDESVVVVEDPPPPYSSVKMQSNSSSSSLPSQPVVLKSLSY